MEISMDQKDKNVDVPNSIEEVAIHGKALTEALYEILADKGVLTQMEVIARTRKLTTEIKVNFQQPS
jgi:hypothetical protein